MVTIKYHSAVIFTFNKKYKNSHLPKTHKNGAIYCTNNVIECNKNTLQLQKFTLQ